MSRLKQVPLLKIFVFYAIGILLADYIQFVLSTKISVVIIAFLISVLAIVFIFNLNRFFQSIFFIFILIGLGILSYISNDERNNPKHFSHYINIDESQKHTFVVTVKNIINQNTKSTKIVADIDRIISKNDATKIKGKILINISNPDKKKDLTIGDIIKFKSYITTISHAQNPKTFDPREYYYFQNIHFMAYIKPFEYTIISSKGSFRSFFRSLNLSIQKIIKEKITNKENANIVISIMLGDKLNLDKDILDTFASTGTRHILTVSGMHVGIVALLLNFLFNLVIKTKNNYFNLIKIGIIISFIWFYTFLTGAGTATMRAAFMISLLIIGINIRKKINTFNLLFGSALIILTINPYQLFQLSFILSYAAMLSILIFYSPVYNKINLRKYMVFDYLWQLISLSIAAQILVFPLSIYYFHNAPLLFILTALIATPMAFIAISLGFAIVIIGFLSTTISVILANILNQIITYSLVYIYKINSISVNIGEHLFFDKLDIIIIFITIAFIYILLKYKIYKYGVYTIIMLFTLFLNQYLRTRENSQIAIYSSYNKELIDIFYGDKCYAITDSSVTDNEIKYTAKNYRIYKNKEIENITENYKNNILNRKSNILEVDGKTIVLLESKFDLLPTNRKQIDILILKNKINFNIEILLEKYKINTVVLMKGIKYKLRHKWYFKLKKAGIKYWDINTEGAFINEIKSI